MESTSNAVGGWPDTTAKIPVEVTFAERLIKGKHADELDKFLPQLDLEKLITVPTHD